MHNLKKWLSEACSDLNLEFHFDSALEFPRGKKAYVIAFLPHLGAKTGIIVFPTIKELRDLEKNIQMKIEDTGYAFSVLWDKEITYNRSSAIKIFSDWSWCGPEETKPSWMIDIQYDDEGNSIDP